MPGPKSGCVAMEVLFPAESFGADWQLLRVHLQGTGQKSSLCRESVWAGEMEATATGNTAGGHGNADITRCSESHSVGTRGHCMA